MDDNRQLLTKTQLRAGRLKPTPSQWPASHHWQGGNESPKIFSL